MATFNVLDGRQYRSDQPQTCLRRDASGYCVENLEPSRTMLGAEQREWLLEDLATTKARWNILAQQTAFAPLNNAAAGAPPRFTAGADNWEGYVAERQAIIDWAVEHQTPNFVVLTGDRHRNWVRDIPRHYTSLDNPIGTEFLGTSVSTGSDPAAGRAGVRRPQEPAPSLPQQQPRLREVHAHPRHVDDRVSRRGHGRAAGITLPTRWRRSSWRTGARALELAST